MSDAPSRVEGTLDYISPEVAAGSTLSSYASDAWAFGCVLYQLIAGRTPVLPESDVGHGDESNK